MLQISDYEFSEAISEIEWRTGAKVSMLRYRSDGRLLADIFMDDRLSQTVEIIEAPCALVA